MKTPVDFPEYGFCNDITLSDPCWYGCINPDRLAGKLIFLLTQIGRLVGQVGNRWGQY